MRTILLDAGPIVHFGGPASNLSADFLEHSVFAEGMGIIIDENIITSIEDSQSIRDEYSYHGNEPKNENDFSIRSLEGRAVIPGLIDTHTHLLWAGDRSQEVRWKQEGKSYQDISNLGGGIAHTTHATRLASPDYLYQLGYERMRIALRAGTTHMEVKSGYGLNTETELKLLEVAHRLGQIDHLPSIDSTWLGAHDVPKNSEKEEYVEHLVSEQLPAVVEQGFARSADVFCEPGWFTIEDSERILRASKDEGLSLRMHIDEFTNGGGGSLAADLKVQSADHSYHTPMDTRLDMKDAGVITGFLPGTPYSMGDQWPDMMEIMRQEIPFTLATDFNPNCQTLSLPFMGSLMVQRCGVNPLQALYSVTRQAAESTPHSTGLAHGRLTKGSIANLNVLDSIHWESWALKPSHTPFHSTMVEGQLQVH